MHECNNNFAFPSHSSIYSAILSIHCFFFPLVYVISVTLFTIVITRCPSSLTFHIFYFSSETAERNSTKLDRKKDLNVLYQVCVLGPIGKTRWPSRPLIGWDIFDFFAETAERNSTKLDRKVSTSSTKFVFLG